MNLSLKKGIELVWSLEYLDSASCPLLFYSESALPLPVSK